MTAPVLKTKRLLLRPWGEVDLEFFSKINADPKVMEFFPSSLTKEESDELANRIQKELHEKNYGMWAVEIPSVASFVGCVGLHYQDFKADFAPCVEIGWRLDSHYWDKGYATEAAKAVLEYGFSVLKLNEIVAFTPHQHKKSIKIMEKLKMKTDPKENFLYPKISKDHPLQPFVLYRIQKRDYIS